MEEETETNTEKKVHRKPKKRMKRFHNAIRQQIEFYLGDVNLCRDRFFSNLMQESPYIDIDVILKCNKIKQMTEDPKVIARALEKSTLISVSEDGKKIFRKIPVAPITNADDCTIYVEDLPLDADHDWLKSVFSRYGEVVYTSIPHYRTSRRPKGFAFIQFSSPESAEKALEAFRSVNSCLFSTMEPVNLRSIKTFEGEKNVVVRSRGEFDADQLKCVNTAEDSDNHTEGKEPSHKKRKRRVTGDSHETKNGPQPRKSDSAVTNANTSPDPVPKKKSKKMKTEVEPESKKMKKEAEPGSKKMKKETEPGSKKMKKETEPGSKKMKTEAESGNKKMKREAEPGSKEKTEAEPESKKMKTEAKAESKKIKKEGEPESKEMTEAEPESKEKTEAEPESKERTEAESESKGIKREAKLESKEKTEGESESKKMKTEASVESSADELKDEENESLGHRRKRKKAKKNEPIQTFGMQILSKIDWKRLRNKYLEEQRNRMGELKYVLRHSREQQEQDEEDENNSNVAPSEGMNTEPADLRAKFIPGVIVKILLDQPLKKVKSFKTEAKRYVDVEYIDAAENSHIVHFRCTNNEIANQIIGLNKWPNMTILKGDEEQAYWEKIKNDRKEKIDQKIRCVIRGKNKLMKRAETLVNRTHIRFSDD